jgi:hypothetical protein
VLLANNGAALHRHHSAARAIPMFSIAAGSTAMLTASGNKLKASGLLEAANLVQGRPTYCFRNRRQLIQSRETVTR